MAVNLRLEPELARALRDKSTESGVSQQEILRRALIRYLEVGGASPVATYRAAIRPARQPFTTTDHPLVLPPSLTSLDLLDREDRF
ncbi:CopG family transcriptional regulator [Agromyces larvae]|uniref:Ribbon-helix-helix domain-containing protein n=1 Tax=Agromyces larvae TaxID=2929802 RepID=A0ABY4BW42_9MICO|nr:CopG family transcriptional regulator [Agromyces larvae]UOE43448.1 ribbon-helix-helix domain-containing protein [Agromyces larvae]